MNGYTVFYIEECTDKKKWFKTELAARRFINKFLRNRPNSDDYWIDCLVYGRVVEQYNYDGTLEYLEKAKA